MPRATTTARRLRAAIAALGTCLLIPAPRGVPAAHTILSVYQPLPPPLPVLTALATTRLLVVIETWVVPTYRQVKTIDRALHYTYAQALGLAFKHRQHHHIDDRSA